MNGAGAASPRQPQWNQQQWQQQPHYAPPIQPQPMHSGPYRGQNAAHSSHNQAAAYSPHTQQQQQQPAQYPYQASAPAMHSPSPAPPSYGYSPSAPQHQNLAANNGNAQNWPGAYAAGSQAGPPSKKARYQASAAPAPVPPYGAPGVAPVAPMGGNMAGGAPGPYGPGAANPPPPPPQQQPYAWQAPMSAPVAPHMSPQPGQQGKFGRLTSGSAGRGGLSAQSARGGKNGRGAGGVGVGVGVGNGPGRGMNRNGAQNRGNLSQGPSGGQRAALPANPNASMNPQRAQNGPASAWGPCANAPSAAAAAPSGPAGQSAGAGRRASTASSVHSDKNGRRAGGPSVNGAGSVTKPGFSSQNMIPIDAPRGPNVARNKAGKGDKDASSSARKGTNASADNANNATAARSSAVDANASAKDSSHGASSKRAHTDFRILELEIKELDWSWFGSKALSKSAQAADGGEGEVKHEPGREVAEPNEAAADAASQAGDNDESSGGADPQAEGDERAADLDEAQTTRNDVHNDEENQNQNADPTVEAEPDSNENNNHDDEEAGYDEHELDAEGKANDDAEAEADDDADGEADADADKDLDADANDDAEPEADADAAEDQPEANGDENVSMSHVETDTVASNAAHSVAPTPEPSSELTNGKQAVQATKGFKADRAKMMANLRDSTKLRFCFAAMSNAGPEGAPTGPKADQVQEATEVASTDFKVKTEDIAEGAEAQTEPEDEDRTAEDPAAVEAETGPEAEAEAEKPANEDAATVGEVKVDAEASAPDAAAKDEETLEEQPVMDPAADSTDKNEGAKHEEDNKEKVPAAESSNEAKQSDQPAITASSKGKKPKSAAESVPQAKGPPQLSLNRIFLSFAANRKRLAIDAEAIKSVKIHRSEHWVEIVIDTSRQTASAGRKKGEEYLVCNGTLVSWFIATRAFTHSSHEHGTDSQFLVRYDLDVNDSSSNVQKDKKIIQQSHETKSPPLGPPKPKPNRPTPNSLPKQNTSNYHLSSVSPPLLTSQSLCDWTQQLHSPNQLGFARTILPPSLPPCNVVVPPYQVDLKPQSLSEQHNMYGRGR